MICIYVDDTLCIGDEKALEKFISEIKSYFNIIEEGTLDEYVGCELKKISENEITMMQSNLIKKIKRNFEEEIDTLREYRTPASTNESILRPTDYETKISGEKQQRYRSGVGMLLYLIKYSRPDISNSVRELSKVNDGATEAHWKSLMRVMKYVTSTENRSLRYKVDLHDNDQKWEIKGFSDSDYAGDKDTRISVTGYCVYVSNCLVSWKSRGQKSVTLSSTEAEYVAISEISTEIMSIKMILEFMGLRIKYPIIVHCDNVGAIYLGYNAKTSQRTKHVDIRYKYVNEYVEDAIIKIVFVRTEDNDADVFTKNTSEATYLKQTSKFMTEEERDSKIIGKGVEEQ